MEVKPTEELDIVVKTSELVPDDEETTKRKAEPHTPRTQEPLVAGTTVKPVLHTLQFVALQQVLQLEPQARQESDDRK